MPPKSRLLTQTYGDITLAFITEIRILDEATVQEFATELLNLVNNTYRIKLCINFQNVEYLSSAVLGKLVAVHKLCVEAKGELRLCCIKPAIKAVFAMTKLDKLFQIHDDMATAVNAFKRGKFV